MFSSSTIFGLSFFSSKFSIENKVGFLGFSSKANFFINILNSKTLHKEYNLSLSIPYCSPLSSTFISKSVKILASSLLINAISFSFIRFFIREGPIPSMFFKLSIFS